MDGVLQCYSCINVSIELRTQAALFPLGYYWVVRIMIDLYWIYY